MKIPSTKEPKKRNAELFSLELSLLCILCCVHIYVIDFRQSGVYDKGLRSKLDTLLERHGMGHSG